MNKINPLYILALTVVVLLISFQLLIVDQINLQKSQEKLRDLNSSIQEYNSLKSSVSTKKQVIKEIETLLKKQDFIEANIETKIFDNKAFLKLVTNKKNLMQKFINRLLNKNMKINRMEATKEYIIVEVKL